MAVFKCKMCGAQLTVEEGKSIAECEYCGSIQTVTVKKDDVNVNLFNRANNIRMKNDFDKAAEIYEKILDEDDTDAEAHWGLVLCKYGIEYVDDPSTGNKVPTCHRTLVESILVDPDYKSALQNADLEQRALYEKEAHQIAEIQKGILEISSKEEPFDIFICYKETDESGKRTQDSSLANDIYYQLTEAGYKVFYAAITLEDKLGSEYEPYIFAALNSAKIMLVVGTKPEYFNAVWVKNEWSRYLALMKKDRSKKLFPCYKDMDPYDLPEEFGHLQGQDMSKMAFIQDLIRNVKKIIVKDEPKPAVETVKEVIREVVREPASAGAAASGNTAASLLQRAFLALEDGEFGKANDFCEKALNIDPENARAYLGKLMAELKCNTQDDLKNCSQPFDEKNNYQKVLRFGDQKLKNELAGYISFIKNRNEEARRNGIYTDALQKMQLNSDMGYNGAIELFSKIPDYKDSKEKIKECREKRKALQKRNQELHEREQELQRRQDYNEALKSLRGFTNLQNAKNKFESLKVKGYEASDKYDTVCQKCIEIQEIEKKKNSEHELVLAAMRGRINKAKAKDKLYIAFIIVGLISALFLGIMGATGTLNIAVFWVFLILPAFFAVLRIFKFFRSLGKNRASNAKITTLSRMQKEAQLRLEKKETELQKQLETLMPDCKEGMEAYIENESRTRQKNEELLQQDIRNSRKIGLKISKFICFILILGAISGIVWYKMFIDSSFEYKIEGDGAVITKVDAFAPYMKDGGKNLIIPDTLGGKKVVAIGENAFDNFTKIDKSGNYSCLTSITIPDSVTSIGDRAFYSLKIKSINYTGTVEQWKAISKDWDWKPNRVDDFTVYCTDGEVVG